MMEQAAGAQVQNCNNSSTSLHTLHRSTHIVLKKTKEILKVGDIRIPHFVISPNHFTKIFILGIEVFFQASDKILKVETLGLSSQLVCWKL
jgi:hypothetical protein